MPPYRDQILELLSDGDNKTGEMINAIEGNPVAIKHALSRLVELGVVVRVRHG